jgi:uncharacterized membrane protein
MAAAYAAFFSAFMVLRHRSFMTYMLDLGAYAQNLWLILHEGARPIHNSPLMYPLALLYALFPSPETLLVLKSIVVPLAALPLYKLAKIRLRSRAAAVGVSALYLLYPPLHGVSQFDFHLEDFLPLLFIASTYFHEAARPKLYLASLALCLATMSFASYIAIFYGLWLLLRNVKLSFRGSKLSIIFKRGAQVKLAVATIALSIIAASAYLTVMGAESLVKWGASSFNPSALPLMERANYLSLIYGPLAFMPLASLSQLAALPWLVFAFITPSRECLAIYNQYPAFITPFIFIGAIEMLHRFHAEKGLLLHLLAAMFLASMVYFSFSDPVFMNPYPPHMPSWPVVTEKDRQLSQIIQLIPPDASVLTQNNIAPHLANRRELYITLIDARITPKFILVDRSHFSFDEPNIRPSPAQLLPILLQNADYGLRAVCGPIELYELGYSGSPLRLG